MFNQSNLLILKVVYNIHKSCWVHSLPGCTSAEMKQADQEDPLWHSENLKQTHKYKHSYSNIYVHTAKHTIWKHHSVC